MRVLKIFFIERTVAPPPGSVPRGKHQDATRPERDRRPDDVRR
jgi:hypothetical protein